MVVNAFLYQLVSFVISNKTDAIHFLFGMVVFLFTLWVGFFPFLRRLVAQVVKELMIASSVMHKQLHVCHRLRNRNKPLFYLALQFLLLLLGKLIILRVDRRNLYPLVGFLHLIFPLSKPKT